MSQVFRIWLIPWYKAPVTLVTVLDLVQERSDDGGKGKGKYYVQRQNDLYQVDQFIKFIPGLAGGAMVVWVYQFFVTFVCLAGVVLLWPVTWWEENVRPKGWIGVAKE